MYKNLILLALLVFFFKNASIINAQSSKGNKAAETEILTSFIHYYLDEAIIRPEYINNSSEIKKIRETLSSINITIDSIFIHASTSPEGSYERNVNLAKMRAENFKNLLLNELPAIKQNSIRMIYHIGDWTDLIEMVEKDRNTPAREEVLNIIRRIEVNTVKEKQLRSLHKGKVYEYLDNNFLYKQRNAYTCFIVFKDLKETKEPEKPIEEVIKENPVIISRIVTDTTIISPPKRIFALKTNLAYLGATVANIGFEYPINNKFSVDVPFLYSPYMFSRNYRIEILGLQPELRYWFNKSMRGHAVGLHAHLGWYTVAMNDKDRYQDKDGNTPLWGAGIGYAYTTSLSKRWNLEFIVGAGYANLNYDIFHNKLNGAKYATQTKDYWGITRFGINLVYKINMK